MNNLIGQQLGTYRIMEEIGRGGMAVVYKAWDTDQNRHVALKVLPPYFQHDTEFLRRFLEEARRTVSLRHSYVVETYEAGQANGYYYIAMEYMDSGSLATRLRTRTRLGLEEATTVLSQIADALDHAHAHGLIHRDVKPSNILFDKADHAKLADFGIAKAADQATVTLPGTLVGTPEYMSPEQAQGRPVDDRTDIWSLGVILYQMLTGRLPFVGENPHAILYQVVRQRHRPATSLNPRLPKAVDTILGKALEKSPRRRYRRAGEMAAALRQVVHRPTEEPTVLKGEAEPPTQKLTGEAVPGALPLPSVPWPIFGGLGAAVVVLFLVLSGMLVPPIAPTGGPATTTPTATSPVGPIVFTVTQTPGAFGPTPALAFSPTPTPLMLRLTATPTASSTATQTSTTTPTSTATATPTSTVTHTPRPTPTATTTAMPPAAITLIQPANGAIAENLVTLAWQWAGTLGAGEVFDVRVCKGSDCQPQFGKTNTKEKKWENWCPDWVWVSPPNTTESIGAGDVLRWQVMVIDETSKQEKGPQSEVWSFEWGGGPCARPTEGEGPPLTPTPR